MDGDDEDDSEDDSGDGRTHVVGNGSHTNLEDTILGYKLFLN